MKKNPTRPEVVFAMMGGADGYRTLAAQRLVVAAATVTHGLRCIVRIAE